MGKFLDITGLRFGKLVAKEKQAEKLYSHATGWLCLCDCGGQIVATLGNLRSGNTTSCGCVFRQMARDNMRLISTKHGMSKHPLYPLWAAMIARCHQPRHNSYRLYGAKGITVCDRWRNDFMAFVADMGPRPSKLHSVDRISGLAGYEPSNCRWASATEQAENTSRNVYLEADGRRQTISQWAREMGMSRTILYQRLYRGKMSIEDMLTKPNSKEP